MRFLTHLILLLPIAVLLAACRAEEPRTMAVPLVLDQEKMIAPGKALNSSTQSLNRYNSVLRELTTSSFSFDPAEKTLSVHLGDSLATRLSFLGMESDFLVPLLPYEHAAEIDDFDKANLLLAEFARSGISLSLQEENTRYGFVRPAAGLFNNDEEYYFTDNAIGPNPGVRPLRMSIVNNCLQPGLWEINASDAGGEMYHSWLQLPTDFYFDMVRANNGISTPVAEIQDFFDRDDFTGITLPLKRLRERGATLVDAEARVATTKELGGYSTQDSRRKVQRRFFQVYHNGKPDSIRHFGQLTEGHVFRLHSFRPPGVYDDATPFEIPYAPHWTDASIYEVTPRTSYGYSPDDEQQLGAIEIVLKSPAGEQLIVGNIPVSLLVFSADYSVPAFGAGVLSSSELIERRHLRLREGPLPHYAYLAREDGDRLELLNNHQRGFEQIYLRPFLEGEELYLRFTVVSYERIVDLLEFEIPVTGDLRDRILRANQQYQPPVYEIYSDDNVL